LQECISKLSNYDATVTLQGRRTSGVGAGNARDAAASPSKFFRQVWAKFKPIWANVVKFG